MNVARRFAWTWILMALAASPVVAQESLTTARELYASAEYEAALSTLGRLKHDDTASGEEIARYRVLCLIALGRSAEADQVIESILAGNPLYQPGTEAAPRVHAQFTAVRRRLSPSLARRLYTEAKAAFDRKEFAEAVRKLQHTLDFLDHPDAADLPELADLRTLTAGFLELGRRSLPPPEPPRPAATLEARRTAAPVPPPSDPIVIRQDMPPWTTDPAGLLFESEFRGAIEVEIDEHGNVTGATMLVPIHPSYDPILLKAARAWKYQPARRYGQAVKIRKRVDVVLRPR